MGNVSTGTRLTAESLFKKPFGKRKASNVSTPSSSAKKLKQTNLSRFLTPRAQSIPVTPPQTVTKSALVSNYPDVRFQGSKQDIMLEHALAESWIDSNQTYCLSKQVQTSLKNIQSYAIEKGWKVPNSVKYNIWTCPLTPYAGQGKLQFIQSHKNNPKNSPKNNRKVSLTNTLG